MRKLVALTALVLAFGPAAAAWQDSARSAADRVAGLEKEFNEKQQAAYAGFAKLADAGQEAQQKFLVENMPRPEEFAKLNQDETRPLVNRALHAYTTGSVFKPVVEQHLLVHHRNHSRVRTVSEISARATVERRRACAAAQSAGSRRSLERSNRDADSLPDCRLLHLHQHRWLFHLR